MKIKTDELIGPQLDWAVATCEGLPIRHDPMNFGPAFAEGGFWIWDDRGPIGKRDYRLIGRQYCPSTNWAQGGPIIEREKIEIVRGNDLIFPNGNEKGEYTEPLWLASCGGGRMFNGPTSLVAAMRAFVAIKLGDEIEISEELR